MSQKLQDLTSRVAKAIEVAQRRGFNEPWSLARMAILAMADASREDVCREAESIEKSAPKLRQYSKIARKGWRSRKRVASIREAEKADGRAA